MRFSPSSGQGLSFHDARFANQSNLLDRNVRSFPNHSLTSTQSQIDQLTTNFVDQASDWRSLVPMVVGGLAYRFGKIGCLALGSGHVAAMPLRILSYGLGLGSEVAAFEFTNRTLHTIAGGETPPLHPVLPHLWNWSGPGGWKEGLLSSFITFGTLKGIGRLTQAQNLLFQHGSQDLGMVLGHQLVYRVGLGEKPEGGFAEQLVHAEATNLQMGAGMGLGHVLTGGRILSLERRMDLAALGSHSPHPSLQTAGGQAPSQGEIERPPFSRLAHKAFDWVLSPFWMFMGMGGVGGVSVGRSVRRPRGYQEKILLSLEEDLAQERCPWLGLASPMQTGKSYLSRFIIPLVENLFGKNTQVLVLSSSRIITEQLMEDLLGTFEPKDIGRLDGLMKDPKRITVASLFTLQQDKFLQIFPRGEGKLVVLIDEAYWTQAPLVRKILTHLGLGEEVRQGKRVKLKPKPSSDAVLIGLAGTAAALEGYHLSGHLDLLSALEGEWIRPLVGERVFPQASTQVVQGGSERMIWWKATEENARFLADLYAEKIHDRFKNNLVYVPTIHHGELLRKEFESRFGPGAAQFVHSDLDLRQIERSILRWREKGGLLLSVRMLSHGFRGTGAESVFHTYQTSSAELFSQRTGRGWGVGAGEEFRSLYVLEATWDRERFSNLARLLGLVDYPKDRLETGPHLKKIVSSIRHHKILQEELNKEIRAGKAAPFFKEVPLLEEWRGSFRKIFQEGSSSLPLTQETGLKPEILNGFALGALPTQVSEILSLKGRLGGKDKALSLWISSWEQVVDETLQGARRLPKSIEEKLFEWRKGEEDISSRSERLEQILAPYFHPPKGGWVRIVFSKLRASFEKVVEKARAEGVKMSLQKMAEQAHELYTEGLPEGERPSKNTFENYLTGPQKKPEIVKLAEEFLIPPVKIDSSRLKASFQSALQKIEAEGKAFSSQEAAEKAHQIYCEGLEEEEKPSRGTFFHVVMGVRKVPEIFKMLEESGRLLKKTEINEARLKSSFDAAIEKVKKEGKSITPNEIAVLAHQIYSEGLQDDEKPKVGSFKHMVTKNDSNHHPNVLQWIESSGVVEREKRTWIDEERLHVSFDEALRQIEEEKKVVPWLFLINRARQIYSEGLPSEKLPSRSGFLNYLSGPSKNHHLVDKIEKSGWVKKQKITKIDNERRKTSFEKAFLQVKEEGKEVSLQQVLLAAHGIYCEGLPEEARPSLGAFEVYLRTKKDPALLALIQQSLLLKKQKWTPIDRTRWKASFGEALGQLTEKGDVFTPTQLADQAYRIYSQGLQDEEKPSADTFRNGVLGSKKDPEVMALLEKSELVQGQQWVKIDRPRLRAAFDQAMEQARNEGKVLFPSQLAERAHTIYCEGLAQEERPSSGSIRQIISGRDKDPVIVEAMARSGVVKKGLEIDRSRLKSSFEAAVEELKKEGRVITPSEISKLAHRIYCEDLPEDQRPSFLSIRAYVNGTKKDEALVQWLIETSTVKKRR